MNPTPSPFLWNTGKPSLMQNVKHQKAVKTAIKHTKKHIAQPIAQIRQPMVPKKIK